MRKLTTGVRLLSSPVLLKWIFSLVLYCFLYLGVQVIILQGVYKDNISALNDRLDTVIKTEGIDLNLLCTVVSCNRVIRNNKEYINNNGILRQNITFDKGNFEIELLNTNSDGDIVIKRPEAMYVISNSRYIGIVSKLLIVSVWIVAFITTILYFSKVSAEIKRSRLEKGGLKIELENKLQRDLAESLHHEIGTPIAIIESLLEGLYRRLYPCNITEDGVCDFKNVIIGKKECSGCRQRDSKREVDRIAADYYYKIKFSIARLTSIQNLVAGAKHIKYSNGTVAIYEILDNIINSNKNFQISKIQAEYNNIELLKKYACGPGLSNGEMLIAMQSMVTNSIEAKSTSVKFSAKVVGKMNERMELYVTDNGRGVRNKYDEVIKDTDIFNYGYSTKDENGNQKIVKGFIKRLYYKFYSPDETSTRGVGLSVNKAILKNSGGDIELIETSVKGTTFKVTIPIKIRKD